MLEPIPTTGMTADDVNDLMEKTRNVMLKHLKEMDSYGKTEESEKPSAKTTATSMDQDEGSVKKRKTLKE